MKTVYAPDTAAAYLDAAHAWAAGNPAAAYALGVAALMALCWAARDYI